MVYRTFNFSLYVCLSKPDDTFCDFQQELPEPKLLENELIFTDFDRFSMYMFRYASKDKKVAETISHFTPFITEVDLERVKTLHGKALTLAESIDELIGTFQSPKIATQLRGLDVHQITDLILHLEGTLSADEVVCNEVVVELNFQTTDDCHNGWSRVASNEPIENLFDLPLEELAKLVHKGIPPKN